VHDVIDFTDRVVLVTGGTKGIGRGIAESFAARGATVVTCARRPADKPLRDGIEVVTADIRQSAEVTRLVDHVAERYGRIDVLVNNAGGSPPADSASASPRFSEAIIRLNLLAPLWLAQAVNAIMQAQSSGGAIINIASVSGMRPSPDTVAYGAAKAGLINLTETLAVEWAPKVRVNTVTPGYIRTEQAPLFYGDEAGIARVAATVPLGRLGNPADVADACLFMASPLAAYVSGANLVVHGGGEAPRYLSGANDGAVASERGDRSGPKGGAGGTVTDRADRAGSSP
jgi:NAD(P)-dependent dehydrogenase (short-subunit alcohol dehydrogenase family)